MQKPHENEEELQIDLLELLFAFKKRLWLILLAAVLGGMGAGIYSKVVLTPVYTSTAMVYVLSKETTLTSLADLQIGSQLTKDYQVIVTSRPVLEKVIEKQGLDMTYEELRRQISISNPADTRILSLTVSDSDPVRAKAVADEVAQVSSDYIGDIMEMVPPKVIEEGVIARLPVAPSVKRNAAIGSLTAAFGVCGVIAIQVILNDTVRSEEDVEKYLKLTVLASIPDDRSQEERKRQKDRRRRQKMGKGREK